MRSGKEWYIGLVALCAVLCACVGLFYIRQRDTLPDDQDHQTSDGCVSAFTSRESSGEFAPMVFLDQTVCPDASDPSLINIQSTFSTEDNVKFLEWIFPEYVTPSPITLVSSTFVSATHVTREQPYSFEMVLRVPPNTPYKYVSFGLTAYIGVGKSEPDGPMYGAGSSFYVCRRQEKIELLVLKPEEELRELGVCSPEITQR